MGRTVNPLLRFRRFESFSPHLIDCKFLYWEKCSGIISINFKSGSSSVGRAIAFQAIGREFEPRLPLLGLIRCSQLACNDVNEWESRCSSVVEYFLGKEEVMGSSPIIGSKVFLNN